MQLNLMAPVFGLWVNASLHGRLGKTKWNFVANRAFDIIYMSSSEYCFLKKGGEYEVIPFSKNKLT